MTGVEWLVSCQTSGCAGQPFILTTALRKILRIHPRIDIPSTFVLIFSLFSPKFKFLVQEDSIVHAGIRNGNILEGLSHQKGTDWKTSPDKTRSAAYLPGFAFQDQT
jgi:hypothetical protein